MFLIKRGFIGKFIGVATAVFLVLAMMPGLAWAEDSSSLPHGDSTASEGVSLSQEGSTSSEAVTDGTDTDPLTLEEIGTTEESVENEESVNAGEESGEINILATDDSSELNQEKLLVNNQPDVTIKKEVSDDGEHFSPSANIGPGGTVYYKLIFQGQGSDITSVTITDILPAGFNYIKGSAIITKPTKTLFEPITTTVGEQQKLTWEVSEDKAIKKIEVGAEIIYEVIAEPTPSGTYANPYKNSATETYSNTTSSAEVNVLSDDLLVEKEVSFDGSDGSYKDSITVAPESTVFFKITVTNKGNQEYSNLSISDVLPEGFVYQSGSASLKIDGSEKTLSAPTINDNIVVWSMSDADALSTGETATLKFQVKAGTEMGTFENRGSVWKSTIVDGKPFIIRWASDTAEVSVGPSLNKKVKVAGSTDDPGDKVEVPQGQKVTYQVVIENPFEATSLTNVKIEDTLPPNFKYVSSSSKVSWNDGTNEVTKQSGDADPDQDTTNNKLSWPKTNSGFEIKIGPKKSLTLTYDVEASKTVSETPYENKAVFSADSDNDGEADTFGSDTAKVTVILKGVKKEVSADGATYSDKEVNVTTGALVYYKITVTNADTKPITVTIEDTLPSGFTYQTGTTKIDGASGDDPGGTGQTRKWSPVTIAAGTETAAKDTVLTYQAKASTTVGNSNVNTVRVLKDTTFELGKDTANVKITGAPSISITKTVDKSSASPNDTLTYTITYKNTGNVQLTNVVITDGIPTNTTYVAGSATNNGVYDQAATAITWTVGNLAVGESDSVKFQALINSTATGTITNTASITSAEITDPKTASASTTVTVVLTTTEQQPATLPGETGGQAAQQAAAQQLPTTLPKTGIDLLGYIFGVVILVSSGLFLRRLGREE